MIYLLACANLLIRPGGVLRCELVDSMDQSCMVFKSGLPYKDRSLFTSNKKSGKYTPSPSV